MSVWKGSRMIAMGNVKVDGETTSFNENHSLQAIGTKNKNTESSTVGIYDWVGTIEEYNEQNVGALHPDWLCFITNDEEMDIENYYTKAATEDRFAHRDGDNFTPTGTTFLSRQGMPDFMRAEEITILAVGAEYTAPANGYFVCTARSGNDNLGTIQIANSANSTLPDMRVSSWATGASNRGCGVIFPAKADDTIRIYYNNSATDKYFYFIYAEGNPSNS